MRMKLTVKVSEINYSDVAVRLLPMLHQATEGRETTKNKLIAAVSQLPEAALRAVFDAIPEETKRDLLASGVAEYQEKLLNALNHLLEANRIGLHLAELMVNQALEVSAVVDRLDEVSLAELLLPMLKEKLLSMGGMVKLMHPLIRSATAEQMVGLLDRILGEKKEAFLVNLINQHSQTLGMLAENAAQNERVHLKLAAIVLEE